MEPSKTSGKSFDPGQIRAITRRGLDIVAGFEALPFPTVVAIDGSCMGGGLELSLGCDYRLTGSNPKVELGFPEVKIGLFPGWGGTQRLPRVIGPAHAAEMICSGDSVKPGRARQLGLIFDAVPPERLMDEAQRVLEWAAQTGAWREARRQKQQPVGLSEDQRTYTYAVARAVMLEKTKGQLPAPPAALDA